MSKKSNNLPQLVMRRSLLHLPELNLPLDLTVRAFTDSDEEAWNNIIAASFEDHYSFNEFIKKDAEYKAERVMIALIDCVPVATASAWYKEQYGKDTGYVHMVGALPEYKGRKLGYWVSLSALHKLKNDGFTDVVLQTDDFRLPAIKTYINLGFEIDLISHDSIPERWGKIRRELNKIF